MHNVIVPLLVAVTLVPCSAVAQLCTGLGSFSDGPFQASATAAFNDNAKSFGGGFAFGRTGAFGSIGVGATSFDEFDGTGFNVSGGAGYQIALDRKGLVHLCPTGGVAFLSGPNDVDVFGDGSVVIDLSETDIFFGVDLGLVATQSGGTQIVPAGSLGFVSATVKGKDQVSGASDSQSESFGLLGLGIGFIFNKTVALHPRVSVPFGLEGASASFGLTLSINFGNTSR